MDQHERVEDGLIFTAEELASIEAARAEAKAGLVVDFDDVEAWLDSPKTLPRPSPAKA